MVRGVAILALAATACSTGTDPGAAGSGGHPDASAVFPTPVTPPSTIVSAVCPTISGISAPSLSALIGGSLQVEAIPPSLGSNHTFTFAWSEGAAPPIGEIADPTARTVTFTCRQSGSTWLNLAVSDGSCEERRSPAIYLACLTAVPSPSADWPNCRAIQQGEPACDSCTNANCSVGPAGTDGCCHYTNPADIRRCLNLVSCIRANASTCVDADGDPTGCFCGTSGEACFAATGAADGPCVPEVVAAAGSTVPTHIREHLVDAASPLGRAINVTFCQGYLCEDACVFPSSPTGAGGAGGAGGVGGTAGTGGASGSGGAAGTGGGACSDQTVDGPACLTCTARECSTPFGSACCGLASERDRQLCADALACFEANDCAGDGGSPSACFCGTSGRCFLDPGVANGPCVAQVNAAAGSAEPGVIELNWVNFSTALGRAVGAMSCRGALCGTECPHSE